MKFTPKLTLVDQFGVKTEVKTKGTITLLLSFEKDVSKDIKAFLEAKKKNFLTEHNAMYISDISNMPSMITRWVALPKMKKFNFKVALIYNEKEGKLLNRREGKASVIRLKNNIITAIEFVEAKMLNKVLN